MSDEEDDYMSEEILNACAKNDVRPGLLYRQADKRSNNLHKRKVEKDVESRQPKKGKLEAERRQIGLDQPLGQDNKGFALLQKMGFAPGGTIGKPGGSSGLREPVAVVVKTDRAGLGRESALKEVRQRKEAIRARKVKKPIDLNEYRSQLSSKFNNRAVGRDLRVSQLACQDLDSKNNIDSPAYPWFWVPQHKKEKKDEDDEEEDENKDGDAQDKESEEEEEAEEQLEPEEQLEMLTLYLRKTYFYCIWCGIEFKDEDDLQEDCPGNTKNDH